MKVKKDDYKNLCNDFETVVKKLLLEYKTIDSMLVAIIEKNDKVQDASRSLRWYIFHSIPDQYNRYTKLFYSYDCNDSHIDTALKSILKELRVKY